MRLSFTCNGDPVEVDVPVDASLLEVVRSLGLTGTKAGCEVGVCGLCTALLGELPVSACLLLAPCAEGAEVWTIEGIARRAPDLVDAFVRSEAMQCGICTPGQVVATYAAAAEGLSADADGIEAYLSGNLCRCTGYQTILDAARSYLAGR